MMIFLLPIGSNIGDSKKRKAGTYLLHETLWTGNNSNRHEPAYMVDAIADIETYLAGRSICCKKLSRFSLKDELTFLPWALLFPVALQNYKKTYNWQ